MIVDLVDAHIIFLLNHVFQTNPSTSWHLPASALKLWAPGIGSQTNARQQRQQTHGQIAMSRHRRALPSGSVLGLRTAMEQCANFLRFPEYDVFNMDSQRKQKQSQWKYYRLTHYFRGIHCDMPFRPMVRDLICRPPSSPKLGLSSSTCAGQGLCENSFHHSCRIF